MAPRRAPAQDRAKETLEAILDATEQVLEDEGMSALTTAKIAARAEISAATIYLYFPNKNAVLYGLLERWLGFVNEVMDQHDATRGQFANWMQWADSRIDASLAVYQREPGLAAHYSTITAIPQLRKLDADHDRSVIARSKASLRYFLPDADDTDLELASTMLLTLVHNVVQRVVGLPE